MTDKELHIAKQLGEQVYQNCGHYLGSYYNNKSHNKQGKVLPLYCPKCQEFAGPKDSLQPLSSFGDNREILFCPHCDMSVQLIVEEEK